MRSIVILMLLGPLLLLGQEIDKLNEQAFSKMIYRDRIDTAYQLAKAAYNQAIQKHPAKAAVSMVVIGRYYQSKFQLDTANEILSKAREILLKHKYHKATIYASTYLGLNQNLKEDTYQARKYFEEAESLLGAESDNYIQMHIYGGLGHVYERRGNYPKSLDYFNKKLSVCNSDHERIRSLLGISRVYTNLKEFSRGKNFALEALRLLSTSKSLFLKADIYEALILNSSASGKIDSAIYYTTQIIESTPRDKQHHISSFATTKGALYFKLQEYQKAIESIELAFELKSMSSYSINEEADYWYLSKSYFALGEFDRALENAYRSLQIAKEKRSLQSMGLASKLISDLYYSTNRLDSAVLYLRSSLIYKDSVFNDETQKKFADMRVEIETLEKQKLINTLESQKVIDQANQKILLITIISISTVSIALIVALIYRQRDRKKRQKIKELELNQSIEKKELQLQQQALHMINLNNSISEVEEKLKEVKKKKDVSGRDVQRVLSNITVSKSMDKEWKQFESYFSNIHPNFSSMLMTYSEKLTHQERRLAVLIKLDLSNREISNLLNIEPKSVSMNKYRLKKKLGLDDSEDLTVFIQKS